VKSPALAEALDRASTNDRGTHRLPPPPSALRGRVVVAAVAFGAFAAAAAGQTLKPSDSDSAASDGITPLASGIDVNAAIGIGGGVSTAPEILPVTKLGGGLTEAEKLAESQRITAGRLARIEAAKAEAARPKFFKPAEGSFTSGFGARWGTTHLGIDIANRIGTPIYSVADGVVIESGPASGFGLWVRVQHSDGTITIYGHIDRSLVSEGQKVKAGQQIAKMGNRGQSTGPHLHFEVWLNGTKKINPLPWLQQRGVAL
jgi:murein DD-endopeptidase MepM/ murein hydrolase activator NlpD